MTTHVLKLAAEPYNAIAMGKKTIESRLYDHKRRLIKLGDTICFVNREETQQIVSGQVVGLLRYRTFEDLFSHHDPRKFGGPNVAWLLNQIREFYAVEAEAADGVIGIEFELS